jgi:hypothetical protein
MMLGKLSQNFDDFEFLTIHLCNDFGSPVFGE